MNTVAPEPSLRGDGGPFLSNTIPITHMPPHNESIYFPGVSLEIRFDEAFGFAISGSKDLGLGFRAPPRFFGVCREFRVPRSKPQGKPAAATKDPA